MSTDVVLKVNRSPVSLQLQRTSVALGVLGGRGPQGGAGPRGPGAVIGLSYAFAGTIVDSERLPGYPVYQAATYNAVLGWCQVAAEVDAVFKLYNKGVDTGVTVTFPFGQTNPVLSAALTVAVGDYIWPKGPSPASLQLSDPAFVLYTN